MTTLHTLVLIPALTAAAVLLQFSKVQAEVVEVLAAAVRGLG